MDRRFLTSFFFLTLLLLPGAALGDNNSNPFSQLEFDKPVKKAAVDGKPIPVFHGAGSLPEQTRPVDPQKVLEILGDDAAPATVVVDPKLKEGASKGVADGSDASSSKGAEKTGSVKSGGSPVGKVTVSKAENIFVVPRLKNPFTDKDNLSLITTVASWPKGKREGCKDAGGSFALCRKAKSLKELLNRFTGNDDFYSSQCQDDCFPGSNATLVSLTLADTRGGIFTMLGDEKATECRYQLGKARDGKWLVLQPVTISCACLPESCGAEK